MRYRWRYKRLLPIMALRCCEHISIGYASHCAPLLHLGEARALGIFKLTLVISGRIKEFVLTADIHGDVIIPETLLGNTVYYFELSTTTGTLVGCYKFETYYKTQS